MTRQEVLNILRAHLPEIKKRFGVKRIGVFGSVARDEATNGSDVDIIVEFEGQYTLLDMAKLKVFLEDIFHSQVDIATHTTIAKYPDIAKEVIYIEECPASH